MSIIKNRLKRKFSQIPNDLVTDKNISPGAFRVIVYLLTKPDNWTVDNKEIKKTLNINKAHTIARYWKQLIDVGWITREKTESGHYDYALNEEPILPKMGNRPIAQNGHNGIAQNGQLPKMGILNNTDNINNNTKGNNIDNILYCDSEKTENFKTELLDDRQHFENTCMALKITKEFYFDNLDTFVFTAASTEKNTWKNYSEFKRHFFYWLKDEIKNGNSKNKNGSFHKREDKKSPIQIERERIREKYRRPIDNGSIESKL